MTTSTDIVNRALQLLGSRTTVTSLAEVSTEAAQANLVYSTVIDWCFAAANWNFARKTVLLSVAKAASGGGWSSSQPPPPWLYEYTLPSDFIRALYMTNTDNNASNNGFLGEPKRFAIATDTIAAVQQRVLLTNEDVAILIYTSRVADPTLWPGFFERFAVSSLASTLCYQLSGEIKWATNLNEIYINNFRIAEQINREEGLVFADTTPEWIIALGIDYPFRRGHQQQAVAKRKPQNDDNS